VVPAVVAVDPTVQAIVTGKSIHFLFPRLCCCYVRDKDNIVHQALKTLNKLISETLIHSHTDPDRFRQDVVHRRPTHQWYRGAIRGLGLAVSTTKCRYSGRRNIVKHDFIFIFLKSVLQKKNIFFDTAEQSIKFLQNKQKKKHSPDERRNF
jgi:hypothetical protein